MKKTLLIYCLLTLSFLINSPSLAQTCEEEDDCLLVIKENPQSVNAYLRLSLIYALDKANAELAQDPKAINKYNKLLFKYSLKAADLGSGNAQSVVAEMYSRGDGVDKNLTEAATWYRKAAEQGFYKQQAKLGAMYYRGDGVSKDIIEAYAWLKNGTTYGRTGAKSFFQDIEEKLTAQERQEAEQRAEEYFKKYVEPYQSE